jgi:hypothetical protein
MERGVGQAHVMRQFDDAGGRVPPIWKCDHPAGYVNLLTGDCAKCGA